MISFFNQLMKTGSFQLAWHHAYHKDHEHWKLTQFNDGRDAFYHSKHRVTCSKCKLQHTAFRHWPKFNADRESGYSLSEAHRLAVAYSGQHLDD